MTGRSIIVWCLATLVVLTGIASARIPRELSEILNPDEQQLLDRMQHDLHLSGIEIWPVKDFRPRAISFTNAETGIYIIEFDVEWFRSLPAQGRKGLLGHELGHAHQPDDVMKPVIADLAADRFAAIYSGPESVIAFLNVLAQDDWFDKNDIRTRIKYMEHVRTHQRPLQKRQN